MAFKVSAVGTWDENQKFKTSQETKHARGCCVGCWKFRLKSLCLSIQGILFHVCLWSHKWWPLPPCRISWFCSAANRNWIPKSWNAMWNYEWVCKRPIIQRHGSTLDLCSYKPAPRRIWWWACVANAVIVFTTEPSAHSFNSSPTQLFTVPKFLVGK